MADSSNGTPFDDLDIPPVVDEELLKIQANMSSLAGLMWFLFNRLIHSGFTRAEALRIVIEWTRSTVWAPQKGAK